MSRKSAEPPDGGDGRVDGSDKFGDGHFRDSHVPGGHLPDGHFPDRAGQNIDGALEGSDDISDSFVVPDDASELDRDLQAWRREEKWRRRREFLDHFIFKNGRKDRGVSGMFLAAVLIALAMLGASVSFLTLRDAKTAQTATALDLASPIAPPGTPGGLLPNVLLSTGEGASFNVRDLRPALIVVVPANCTCDTTLASLSREAAINSVPVDLVGENTLTAQFERLASQMRPSNVRAFVDHTGDFVAAYAPLGLTVVPVHADGVTERVIRNYPAEGSLGPALADLKHRGPMSPTP
jgi:hypothetical protein